jgi:RNA polymerase sigma-70 factor (ECF subfamily)
MSDLEFTKIVNQYTALIFTICHRFVKDYQEAENLTQDTFFTAYRVIDNFVGDNYKPWLVRIATNKCKDFLKSAYYRTTSVAEQEMLEAFEGRQNLENEVESSEQVELIRRACESLKDPYREVALLHFIEDKSFDEIAQLLGRPLKTVQTQGYRARDKLRKILKEEIRRV